MVRRRATLVVIAAATLAMPAPAAAQGTLIDFEQDTPGEKPNGFQSADSDQVRFSDSTRGPLLGLQVQDTGSGETDGQSLTVFPDDTRYLIMDFARPMQAVSMEFGNDDPCCSQPGDEAVLRAFRDGIPIAEVREVMNRNNVMDQSIAYSGQCFTQAEIEYDVTPTPPHFSPGLAEVVDNLRFEPCRQPDGPVCTRQGTSGNDIIRGTPRPDVICAGAGNDVVDGLGGNDRVLGQDGNDILRGGPGNDRLLGGEGNDQVLGSDGNDRLTGGSGRDSHSGQGGGDSLNARDGVASNDIANGGRGDDSCTTDRRDIRSSC